MSNNSPMISVGASPTAVKESRKALLAILKVKNVDSSVKLEAIKAFNSVCSVSGLTIQNCVFESK